MSVSHSPMEQGEIDISPVLIHSPDIEILPDDEETDYSPPYRRRASQDKEDNEEALNIKPPQVTLSRKDKHKHKHKEDRKRDRERGNERPRHGDKDRDRGKHRDRRDKDKMKESYDERLARERERERERERLRRKEVEDMEVEAKRREKSQRERDRLERLERERRKLEREREHREREHKERLKQEQERIAKAEREQVRLAKAEREQERSKAAREQERLLKAERTREQAAKSSNRDKQRARAEPEERRKTHITRQEVEKRRDRDKERHRSKKDPDHIERSRSRSPYMQKESRGRYESHQDHYYKHINKYDEAADAFEEEGEGEDDEEDSQLENLYQSQAAEPTDHHDDHHPHSDQETSSGSSNDTDSEDTDSDSAGSESDDSNRSRGSVSEGENSGPENNHHDDLHPDKLRSKFDDDQEVTTLPESPPPSETDEEGEEEEYMDQTPPMSPVELAPVLPPYFPAIQGCRNVEEFHCLNRIEEGTYGVVYRARDNKTNELVALKRLKMEKEKEGFPITSLREINTLLKAQHPNIVTVREIVVGSNMDKIYIVMDYVEHDLKSLMQVMKDPFIIGEVKTLMQQLLRGVAHLHDNWIIHRDLKTSNLLLSHNGILKIGDFGLAREYGSPLKPYTSIVVTLWYRAPELLLGIKEYSTHIDMWSVGCIFAEFLNMKPLFPGKSEIDELNRIFKDLGTPNEKIWPGVSELPVMKKCTFAEYPYNQLRKKFSSLLTDKGFDLMNRFLMYDPQRRITAKEALQHMYFVESPLPVSPSMFPTWPAKSEQAPRTHGNTPRPPSGGKAYAKLLGDDDEALARGFHIGSSTKGAAASTAFALKF